MKSVYYVKWLALHITSPVMLLTEMREIAEADQV